MYLPLVQNCQLHSKHHKYNNLIRFYRQCKKENSINDKFQDSKITALIVKVIIITIGAFVTLYQLGIAASLVQSAFIIVLGAFAVAFAVSFGIGGRDFASHMLAKLEKKIDGNNKKK